MSPVDPDARDRFMSGPAWNNPKSYEPLPPEPEKWPVLKSAVAILCMSLALWGLAFTAYVSLLSLIEHYL